MRDFFAPSKVHRVIAITDVHYPSAGAVAACVIAAHWTDAAALKERSVRLDTVLPYEPGQFYLRELPCLMAVLNAVKSSFDLVVIDGYVELGPNELGLGGHLHARLGGAIPVVGIAKSAYRGSEHAVRVVRGESRRPLFVTARGLPAARAAELVSRMHGDHRIPTLLARVDALSRSESG